MQLTIKDQGSIPHWLREELVPLLTHAGPLDHASVEPLPTGKSGAMVALVHGTHKGQRVRPKVIKFAESADLIEKEHQAYKDFIKGKLIIAPELRAAGTRVLVYDYAGNVSDNPQTLRRAYGELSSSQLAYMYQKLVSTIADWSAGTKLERPHANLTEMEFHNPPLTDRLAALGMDAFASAATKWARLQQKARASVGGFSGSRYLAHGDLNPGNILVAGVSSPALSFNVIDFGKTEPYFAFYDFARLERDLRFRLYLADAWRTPAEAGDIERVALLERPSGVETACELKLWDGVKAIRDAVIFKFGLDDYSKGYLPTLAYVTLRLIYDDAFAGAGEDSAAVPQTVRDQLAYAARFAGNILDHLLASKKVPIDTRGRGAKPKQAKQATRIAKKIASTLAGRGIDCRVFRDSRESAVLRVTRLLRQTRSPDVRVIGISALPLLRSPKFRAALDEMSEKWSRAQAGQVRLRVYTLSPEGEALRIFCAQTGEPRERITAKLREVRTAATELAAILPHVSVWLHFYDSLPTLSILQAGDRFLCRAYTPAVPESPKFQVFATEGRSGFAQMLRNYVSALDYHSTFEQVGT
jgi:Phosphotransferase enzyme family